MRGRSDHADAFLPDPDGGPAVIPDELAQALGEELLTSATAGQALDEAILDAIVPEEMGGPFVETSAYDELSFHTDPTSAPDSMAEALPLAVAGTFVDPFAGDGEGMS